MNTIFKPTSKRLLSGVRTIAFSILFLGLLVLTLYVLINSPA